jgi:hypothetical protein
MLPPVYQVLQLLQQLHQVNIPYFINNIYTYFKTMSNIFNDVLTDVKGVEQEFLGPSYPYYKNILSPGQIGMSADGNLQTLGKDINGLIQYVEVLVTGTSGASATGQPLGNKFFLQTGAKCTDVASGQQVDRYIYVDNVPTGEIPFISQGLGTDFSDFRGLIPGTMSDLNVLNPFGILQSFMSGSNPPCQELTMQTIDVNNNKSQETQFVTTIDIQNMDPCSFTLNGGVNPATGSGCQQAFTQRNNATKKSSKKKYKEETNSLPKDTLVQIYFAGLACIGLFIFYRIMEKSK